jgi:hypothetical protein
MNQTASTFHSLLSRNAVLTNLTTAGSHSQVAGLLSTASEIRYTDAAGVEFLHARLSGSAYWSALQVPGSSGPASTRSVPVTYVAGPLAGVQRNIEVNAMYHWGHRHNVPYINGIPTHVLDVYPSSCTHTCWEDIGTIDRPFAQDHCGGSVSFCPGTSPGYVYPSTATRNGSFHYRKWVR